jgi:hypothetical protein
MKTTLLVLAAVLVATAAFADDAPAMMPNPMVRQLDSLAGMWRCSGTAYATPMGPEHPTAAEVTMKWDLGGYWLPFNYAEKKTAMNANPFRVTGYFGYDPEIKKLVLGSVDNMGGYSTAASDGWNGDTIVFTGPWHMGPTTVTGRDTFRKSGANGLVHTAELEQNGSMTKLGEETCTRK